MYALGCNYGRSYTVLDVGMPTPIAPQIISGAVWNAQPRVGQALDVSPGTLNDYFPGLTSNTFEVFEGDPAGSGVSIYGPDSLSNIRAYLADAAQEGAILYLRWTVANSEGSATASVAAAGAVLPPLSAPAATLNVDLTGRTISAWLSGVTGEPVPSPAVLDSFTIDNGSGAVEISGTVSGAGSVGDPWTLTLASDANDLNISITASLDNGVDPAWSGTDSALTVLPLAPTVSLTPTSDTVPYGTIGGSTLATITVGGGEGALSLEGADVSLFEIVGTSLQNVADLDSALTANVTVRITNATGDDTAAFVLTVQEVQPLAPIQGFFTPQQVAFEVSDHMDLRGDWQIVGEQLVSDASDPQNCFADFPQSSVANHALFVKSDVVNTAGKVRYTIDGFNGRTLEGDWDSNQWMPASGVTSTDTRMRIQNNSGFVGSVDNMQVYDLSTADPNDVACDVILVFGDSNSTCTTSELVTGTNREEDFDGRIWYMPCIRESGGTFDVGQAVRHSPRPMIEPCIGATNGLRMSPCHSVSIRLVGYTANRGRPLLIMALGDAGSGLMTTEDWRKSSAVGTTGSRMWDEMVLMRDAVNALGPNHEIVGAVLSLGANDQFGGDYEAGGYAAQYTQFFQDFRADIADVPIVWWNLGAHLDLLSDGRSEGMRQMIRRFDKDSGDPRSVDRLVVVEPIEGNQLSDDQDPHYTAAGMQANGRLAGNALLNLLDGTFTAPTYTVSLGALTNNETFGQPGSGADVEAVLSGDAGYPNDPLLWEYSVNNGGAYQALNGTVAAVTGQQVIIRISDTDHPSGSFMAVSSMVTVSAGGDVTAPVLSNNTFDDGTDTADFNTTEAGTLHYAIYLNADGAPTLNSNGTWTGTTQETGSGVVTAPSGSLALSYTTTTGDRLIYGVIDAAGNVSNLITETFSPNVADIYATSDGKSPKVVADFANEYYRVNGVDTDFDTMFTYTGASDKTYYDSNGILQTAASGVPRRQAHAYNGSAWVPYIQIESEARTNLFLNSGTLSTQGVTTTAQAYTVSFSGTGTITFSGAHTGSLVGTGTGEENRVNVTFTPSAGTVTCTVTGTVSNAQFEAGATPSSYILTTGSTVTRAAETLTIPAANMSYSATAMSFQMSGLETYVDDGGNIGLFSWDGGTQQFDANITTISSEVGRADQFTRGPSGNSVTPTFGPWISPGVNVPYNFASRVTPTEAQVAGNGSSGVASTSTDLIGDLSAADFEMTDVNDARNGFIELVRQWDEDIGDTGVEEVSTP